MFPIDLARFRPVKLTPGHTLTQAERQQLEENSRLVRDTVIFVTGLASAKGLGGHTGGPYDLAPEFVLFDAFRRGSNELFPVFFDEAGHRASIHYVMAALDEQTQLRDEDLLHYREHGWKLHGHPERKAVDGIEFTSGRLGHVWSYVNGIALANPGKKVILFSSDGALQEGATAEAARMAVAQKLNVKLLIDHNDMTIIGSPSDYLPGYDLVATLRGHGLAVQECDPEKLDDLYAKSCWLLAQDGPAALINKRVMAPGVAGIEGSSKGHDVISVQGAIDYLRGRGQTAAADVIAGHKPKSGGGQRSGSTLERGKNRDEFGKIVKEHLAKMSPEERKNRALVIDSDLAGSCGLHHLKAAYPEIYVDGGIMERNNFSAAAGFGSEPGRQGIFATFSAFLEMLVSEITMARLNHANVLAHFSHAGIDEMSDNTTHFGISNLFADNGLETKEGGTMLYFPADPLQLKAVIDTIFEQPGLRFIFSTRSAVPYILDDQGEKLFAAENGYRFQPGKDEIIRHGTAGYVVAYGEMLYRALHAVEDARKQGIDVGLINKPTLNVADEEILQTAGHTGFVLFVESQNAKNGVGARYGTWLLERGLKPRYAHMGTVKPGVSGAEEQVTNQGLDPEHILARIRALARE